MAHGDKRWIRTWRGRVKKSRNRTRTDWLAELNNENYRRPKHCPQCRQLKKARPILGYWRRVPIDHPWRASHEAHWSTWSDAGWRLDRNADDELVWRKWKHEDLSVAEYDRLGKAGRKGWRPTFYGSWPHECQACERKWRTFWDGHPTGEIRNPMGQGPADFRRGIERERRSEYRNLMQRAKYVEELYDIVPMKYRRDAAWRYW
jgi:hypothetical protein